MASTRMATCESVCYQVVRLHRSINISPRSLFFLLLSLLEPSRAHDVGGSAFSFLFFFVFIDSFEGFCGHRVLDCTPSPEHDQK